MNKKQFVVLLMFVTISSFLGGAMVQFIFGDANSMAKERAISFHVIKASHFLLVNKNGKICASLSLEDPGGKNERPAFSLYGQDGRSRAVFYLGILDSPQMIFYDKNGKNRFHIGLAAASAERQRLAKIPAFILKLGIYNRHVDLTTKPIDGKIPHLPR